MKSVRTSKKTRTSPNKEVDSAFTTSNTTITETNATDDRDASAENLDAHEIDDTAKDDSTSANSLDSAASESPSEEAESEDRDYEVLLHCKLVFASDSFFEFFFYYLAFAFSSVERRPPRPVSGTPREFTC